MDLFDSHCHLDFDVFDSDLSDVLHRAHSVGVQSIVIPGVSEQQWQTLDTFLTKNASESVGLHGACGLHPYFIRDEHSTDEIKARFFTRLKEYSQKPWVVAIGECGIDASLTDNDGLSIALQQYYFEQHIIIANTAKKPLIVHHRKSHHHIMQSFKRVRPEFGGVIHAFSGSEQDAQAYIDWGFKLGCGGTITYERAQKTRRVFRQIKLNDIILETDAPDMPLAGYQGQRNEPAQLWSVAKCLAEIRGESIGRVVEQTTSSARSLFFNDISIR